MREFVDGVAIAHALVASGAYGPEVVDVGCATATDRDVMTDFKCEGCDDVLTPLDVTFTFESTAVVADPCVFTYSFGYARACKH